MNLLRTIVAPAVERTLPGAYFGCRRAYHRATRYGRLTRSLGGALDWRVAGGPFAGMRYRNTDPAHRPTTKLLGAYESELHPYLATAVAAQPRFVVNIGCAEGYYSVGLALALPAAEIRAYDLSNRARRECAATAEDNGVRSRVRLGAGCGFAELAPADERTLVLCDIEGGECELLDPEIAPGLRRATMIVELHDFLRPGTTALLFERFQTTHRIVVIDAVRRDRACYPALDRWTREDAVLALDEARAIDGKPVHQRWACFLPFS
jgi:hypothetical protein